MISRNGSLAAHSILPIQFCLLDRESLQENGSVRLADTWMMSNYIHDGFQLRVGGTRFGIVGIYGYGQLSKIFAKQKRVSL